MPCASTPQLLSSVETCPRKSFWARDWEANRLTPQEMVKDAIRAVLTAPESNGEPFGELAGSHVIQLAGERGVETDLHESYPSVIHHAALADLLVTTLRKPGDPPWLVPDPAQKWMSACFISPDGLTLRRILLVSHWNSERENSEKRNWWTLGEMAAYNLPMQLIVLVIGHQTHGRRSSPWVKGFLHPINKTIRFRRKDRAKSATFNEAWTVAWREDHPEISREKWLNAMLTDDALREVCFRVDLPPLQEAMRNRILDMSKRKLDAIHALKEKPEGNLSTCFWPVPCPFHRLCWSLPEREPSEKNGFIQIT
jgi:hypothetical protein